MSSLPSHSPIPWQTEGERGQIFSVCKGWPKNLVCTAYGMPTREERAANAAFVVRAVNSYQSLIDALTETLEIATRNEDGDWATRARVALSKALPHSLPDTPPSAAKPHGEPSPEPCGTNPAGEP